jgi:predicted phage tail protein
VPIKSSGYDALTRVPNIETIMLWGCTLEDEARRYGLLRMQMSDALNIICAYDADVDAIECQVGDVVIAQEDGNELSFGGRLADQSRVATTTIKLDQAITLDAEYSGSWKLWLRLADNTVEEAEITGPYGTETDEFIIDTAIATKAQDDVFVIGLSTSTSMQYRVTNIARSADSMYAVAGLIYKAAVYYHSDYNGGATAI